MKTPHYIWQFENWQDFRFDADTLLQPLAVARKNQGYLLGVMKELGFGDSLRALAVSLEEDVVQTAAIEGEALDREGVRSSIAKQLGLPQVGLRVADRTIDGLVQVLLDATQNYEMPLTAKRLYGWHAALFPSGYSGLYKITIGAWRSSQLAVVSGPLGKQKVHYEAPSPESLEREMRSFFHWWRKTRTSMDGLIRAALAHLYFVTIHPFDDGNGRLARCLADMALAQDEKTGMRFYSLSAQIMHERDTYYEILEYTQKNDKDVTKWLCWFLGCFDRAVTSAGKTLQNVLMKTKFWNFHSKTELSKRQKKVVNKLLDAGPGGFEGHLTTRKYIGMTRVSRSTAWREINDMLQKGVLKVLSGAGRNTAYEVIWKD